MQMQPQTQVNNYDSLRRRNSSRPLGVMLAILILLELCSLAILFSRISVWSPTVGGDVFPLTESTDMTRVRIGTKLSDGTIKYDEELAEYRRESSPLSSLVSMLALTASADGGFRVFDENTVWSADTNIEIFKLSYVNGEGVFTVNSDSADKLIAPGTENGYTFTLENTGDVSLDYKMTMEAYVTGTELSIPVVVRVVDVTGEYHLGGEDEWADVLDLNQVNETATIGAGKTATYTLEWQWPFEGDDDYDTMLGNLAAEEDLTLTVKINTIAEWCDDPDDPGDAPQTGDYGLRYLIIALLALIVIVAYYMYKRSRRVGEWD